MKYPIRDFVETPYNVGQHPNVKILGKTYGIIFSVFNQLHVTQKTLPVLVNAVRDVAEVIVVNDGSTDGTREWLKNIKDITIIDCDENLGIAKSQNKAIQLCKYRKYKYVVFHDNDVVMHGDWLNELREYLDNDDKVGVVGATLKDVTLELVKDVKQVFAYFPSREIVSHFSPTLNMTKMKVFDDIGHFDEIFTGFGSQCVDFVMRVYLAGWRAYTLRWVNGIHFKHSTVGVGFKRGWWNDKKMTKHNIDAWMNKWHERFNNSRPFLEWVGERVKEMYGENWLNV